MDFKKGDIVIYPQHGACKVIDPKKKQDPFGTGKKEGFLILETIINEMTMEWNSRPRNRMDSSYFTFCQVGLDDFVGTYNPQVAGSIPAGVANVSGEIALF